MPINARQIVKRYPDGSFEIMSGEIIRPPKHTKGGCFLIKNGLGQYYESHEYSYINWNVKRHAKGFDSKEEAFKRINEINKNFEDFIKEENIKND